MPRSTLTKACLVRLFTVRQKLRSSTWRKTMSADLAGRGIRVNAISPGPVESALLGRVGMSEAELKETQDWIRSQVLIKRFGKPDEVAEAVLYLCSSASSFVVGSELVIDGGMTL